MSGAVSLFFLFVCLFVFFQLQKREINNKGGGGGGGGGGGDLCQA